MKIIGWVQPANFLGGQVPKSRLSKYEETNFLKYFLTNDTAPKRQLPHLQSHISSNDAKNTVEQHFKQFVELVYLENWKNIRKKKIFSLNSNDILPSLNDLTKVSTIHWWPLKPSPNTFEQYPIKLLLKYILFFFINQVSEGWFFNIHSRRISAGRTRTAIRFYFNTLRKSEFGYKSQNGLFMYYFLLNYNKRPEQLHLYFRLKQNVFMYYLYLVYQNRNIIENTMSLELLVKQLLLFLIPAEYVRGHYFLFYNIKRELKVYLNADDDMFDDPMFYKSIHSILLNYLYYKFCLFLTSPAENPFFHSYQFKVLEQSFVRYMCRDKLFQFDHCAYYVFYRLFYGFKKHKWNRATGTAATMWETALYKYNNLVNYLPRKVKVKTPPGLPVAMPSLIRRMSKKLWEGTMFYEYHFGKIRIRTKARWTRERESNVEAQQRLERLWYKFFWKESPAEPRVIKTLKDVVQLNAWKRDNYEAVFALANFMQQSNRIQRALRFDTQMSYVRSLRYGKRKWMFVKLSMKHWW